MERKPGLSKPIGDKDVSIHNEKTHYDAKNHHQMSERNSNLLISYLYIIIVHSKESTSKLKIWSCQIKDWRLNGKNSKRCKCSQ